MIKVQKAGELAKEDFQFITIYGDTGSGKTTMAAKSCKKPLILLTEPNGRSSIIAANKNADVIQITSVDDLSDAFQYVREEFVKAKKAKQPKPWDWIIMDSFTDAQKLLYDAIFQLKAQSGNKNPNEIKMADLEKIGTLTMREWGIIIDRSNNILRQFRALPVHKLLICLKSAPSSDGQDETFTTLNIYGTKLPNQIASMSNIVGYVFRGKKTGERKVMFSGAGSQSYLCKGHVNLKNLESPAIYDWLKKMQDEVKETAFEDYV